MIFLECIKHSFAPLESSLCTLYLYKTNDTVKAEVVVFIKYAANRLHGEYIYIYIRVRGPMLWGGYTIDFFHPVPLNYRESISYGQFLALCPHYIRMYIYIPLNTLPGLMGKLIQLFKQLEENNIKSYVRNSFLFYLERQIKFLLIIYKWKNQSKNEYNIEEFN